jgi:hypothetical protein
MLRILTKNKKTVFKLHLNFFNFALSILSLEPDSVTPDPNSGIMDTDNREVDTGTRVNSGFKNKKLCKLFICGKAFRKFSKCTNNKHRYLVPFLVGG